MKLEMSVDYYELNLVLLPGSLLIIGWIALLGAKLTKILVVQISYNL